MGQIGYRPTTETIAATTAQTVTHADTVIPQGGFRSLIFVNTGANNHLGATTPGIDSIRVTLNGGAQICVNALAGQLRALNEAWNSFLGGQISVSNALRFQIPLDFYGSGKVGIPFGAKTMVETLLNAANSSAGASQLGWELFDEGTQPEFMPRFISQAMGLAASGTEQRVELKTGPNLVVGWALPLVGATGITRIQIFRMMEDGSEKRVLHATQSVLLESQARYSVQSLITTSFFLRLPKPMSFPTGSYMLIDTGAGSAATDAYAPLELLPLK